MKEYNLIVVFNETRERVLMCKRKAKPYKDRLNFVGGKIEPQEDGCAAAYRELKEETSISREDISLKHFMDFTYFLHDIKIEVYVGRLNKILQVHGDENELIWLDIDQDYFDIERFAGDGNIGHIMRLIKSSEDLLFQE